MAASATFEIGLAGSRLVLGRQRRCVSAAGAAAFSALAAKAMFIANGNAASINTLRITFCMLVSSPLEISRLSPG
jgi:hypothetical protein